MYCLQMNEEINRLKTFEFYKSVDNPNYNTKLLAKVGFYATGKKEEISCNFCNRTLARLLDNDDPDGVTLHLRTNSSCPLIRRRPTKNIEHPPVKLEQILPPPFEDIHGIGIAIKYPEFVFLDRRLRSFGNWQLKSPIKEDLAAAGFFSLDEDDKVACFSCGLGLMKFNETDIPFEEHARWGSSCDFLKKAKGKSYIEEIRKKYK